MSYLINLATCITGFKMIFDHQNLGTGIDISYVQISVILADILFKIEFLVMAEHFVAGYPY